MKKLQIIIIGIIITTTVSAQQAVVSGGDYYENSNNTVSWTLGELAIETYSVGDYTLTQGMQQTGLTVVGIDNNGLTDSYITAYPNPTTDFVTVDIKTEDYEDYTYNVVSQSGSTIIKDKFLSKSVELSLTEQSQGIYFMNVLKGNEVVRSFKIVKN